MIKNTLMGFIDFYKLVWHSILDINFYYVGELLGIITLILLVCILLIGFVMLDIYVCN